MYYEPWEKEHIIIDTADKTIEECTKELLEKINNEPQPSPQVVEPKVRGSPLE